MPTCGSTRWWRGRGRVMSEVFPISTLLLQMDTSLVTAEVLAAFQLAERAHRGQERRFSSEPYIMHPVRVAAMVSRQVGATPSHVAAALLHDTLEDTELTAGDLLDEWAENGWGTEAIETVVALTRKSDGTQTYLEFIESLDGLPVAQMVKRCDVIDNLSTLPVGDRLFPRYIMALSVLSGLD